MSSFGGRFGGLTLPPNAIETSAPESGTRRTGGSLPTPDGPRVGLTAPGVTASNGDFSAAQRAADLAQALSGLAGAVGMAGQVAAQERAQTEAEARRTEAEDDAAEALMRAQGVTAAQNELPRIAADIAAGRIARQGEETDEQLIERVMAERTANMSEAEAIGYRARATPVLLENSIRATEEAAKTASVEIGQQMNDLAMSGAMSNDRGLIDMAVKGYMATFRVSQAEAEKEVIIPAMMRAAELGQENVVQNLTAVIGPDRFMAEQALVRAKLDDVAARRENQQSTQFREAVAGIQNQYSTGAISLGSVVEFYNDARRSGQSEIALRPIAEQIERGIATETRDLEDRAQQSQLNAAKANTESLFDTLVSGTGWASLPPKVQMMTSNGEPVLDSNGQPRMVDSSEYIAAAVDRRGRAILSDQSVPPAERAVRLNTWLSTTGLRWDGLANLISAGANAQLGTTDQPGNPESAKSFTNSFRIFNSLGPAVQTAHSSEPQQKLFRAVAERINASTPITPAGLANVPDDQVVAAWRQVAEAKARGVDFNLKPEKLDNAVRELTNTSWALAFWKPDDANQTDYVRSALSREFNAKRLGFDNDESALAAAVKTMQENYRLVGPDLALVNDPRIKGGADAKAALFNRVGTSMAKQFLKDNPPFSRSNGGLTHKDFYLTPVGDGNITDQWQLVYRTDENQFGTTGRMVTIGDLNALLGGQSADRYVALQDAQEAERERRVYQAALRGPTPAELSQKIVDARNRAEEARRDSLRPRPADEPYIRALNRPQP